MDRVLLLPVGLFRVAEDIWMHQLVSAMMLLIIKWAPTMALPMAEMNSLKQSAYNLNADQM